MLGPAAAIAAATGTRFLDAATLRAYVHHRLQADLLHRPVDQVMQAARDLNGLREILFLDPEPGIGLLATVDPQTGTATITSVLTMGASRGLAPGLLRFPSARGRVWSSSLQRDARGPSSCT